MEPTLVGTCCSVQFGLVKWLFQSLFESCWFELVEIILGKIDSDCLCDLCGRAGNRKQRVWVLLCPGFYCIQIHVSPSNLPAPHLRESELSLDLHLPCFSYQQPDQTQSLNIAVILVLFSYNAPYASPFLFISSLHASCHWYRRKTGLDH